jgi:hypothetical protein
MQAAALPKGPDDWSSLGGGRDSSASETVKLLRGVRSKIGKLHEDLLYREEPPDPQRIRADVYELVRRAHQALRSLDDGSQEVPRGGPEAQIIRDSNELCRTLELFLDAFHDYSRHYRRFPEAYDDPAREEQRIRSQRNLTRDLRSACKSIGDRLRFLG